MFAMQPAPQVAAVGSVGKAVGSTATIRRYDVAFATVVQLNVGDVVTPLAPFAGVNKPGAGKFARVVKFKIEP